MDDSRTDPVLKELKRIKWLLVLIAIGLFSLPLSLIYIGWEVASVLLQERSVDDEEAGIERIADGLNQEASPDEVSRQAGRRGNEHP